MYSVAYPSFSSRLSFSKSPGCDFFSSKHDDEGSENSWSSSQKSPQSESNNCSPVKNKKSLDELDRASPGSLESLYVDQMMNNLDNFTSFGSRKRIRSSFHKTKNGDTHIKTASQQFNNTTNTCFYDETNVKDESDDYALDLSVSSYKESKRARFSDSENESNDLSFRHSPTSSDSEQDSSSIMYEKLEESLKRKLFSAMEELVQKSTQAVMENLKMEFSTPKPVSPSHKETSPKTIPHLVCEDASKPTLATSTSNVFVIDDGEKFGDHVKTRNPSQLCFGDVRSGTKINQKPFELFSCRDEDANKNSIMNQLRFENELSSSSSNLPLNKKNSRPDYRSLFNLGSDTPASRSQKELRYNKANVSKQDLFLPTLNSSSFSENTNVSSSTSIPKIFPFGHKNSLFVPYKEKKCFPLPISNPALFESRLMFPNLLNTQSSSATILPNLYSLSNSAGPLNEQLFPSSSTIQQMAYLNSLNQKLFEQKSNPFSNTFTETANLWKNKSDLQPVRQSTGSEFKTSRRINKFSMNCDGLTPHHLKKAKLIFFYVRYPMATAIQTYFSDVRFDRGTTSQLIKWFSNFREFFYIQIEKFARQAIKDGVTDIEQLTVSKDSEIFQVLHHHFNKSDDYQVPEEFLNVVLKCLQEFFLAIQSGKDIKSSWKKPIYKVICKFDANIPENFKKY